MLSNYKMAVFSFICLMSFYCTDKTPVVSKPVINLTKTHGKAQEALQFCKNKKYNTSFCILIDMELHSGVNRFIVWDFEKDTIEHSCLVSHGCCDNPWSYDFSRENANFSSVEGSHCTALGKYKIGERGVSSWGIKVKYLMHGLESGNNNALARQIVFHYWDDISESEVYPDGTPEGWGCPAISNKDMRLIDKKLKQATKPVLMWIYN